MEKHVETHVWYKNINTSNKCNRRMLHLHAINKIHAKEKWCKYQKQLQTCSINHKCTKPLEGRDQVIWDQTLSKYIMEGNKKYSRFVCWWIFNLSEGSTHAPSQCLPVCCCGVLWQDVRGKLQAAAPETYHVSPSSGPSCSSIRF